MVADREAALAGARIFVKGMARLDLLSGVRLFNPREQIWLGLLLKYQTDIRPRASSGSMRDRMPAISTLEGAAHDSLPASVLGRAIAIISTVT